MTLGTIYLHFKDGYVIGFTNYAIDPGVLPADETIVEIETSQSPNAYLGLDLKQIYQDPLPPRRTSPTDETSYKALRQKLKFLYYEISFTKELKEDATELQSQYDTILEDYNSIKP